MVEHGAPDPATARRGVRVHGLHLAMGGVVLLERPHGQKLTVETEGEERHRRVEETVDVEGVDVLGWAVAVGEVQVVPEQRHHVRCAWVVDGDLTLRDGAVHVSGGVARRGDRGPYEAPSDASTASVRTSSPSTSSSSPITRGGSRRRTLPKVP